LWLRKAHQSLESVIPGTPIGSQHQVALLAVWRGKVCELTEGEGTKEGEMKEAKKQVSQEKFLEHYGTRDLIRALRKKQRGSIHVCFTQGRFVSLVRIPFIHMSQNWSQDGVGRKGKREREGRREKDLKKAFPVNRKSIFFPQGNALREIYFPPQEPL
jgi:hypothetical protein